MKKIYQLSLCLCITLLLFACKSTTDDLVEVNDIYKRPDLEDMNRYFVRVDNGAKIPIYEFEFFREVTPPFMPCYTLAVSDKYDGGEYYLFSAFYFYSNDSIMPQKGEYIWQAIRNGNEKSMTGFFEYYPRDHTAYPIEEYRVIKKEYNIDSGTLTVSESGKFTGLHFVGTSITNRPIEIYVEVTESMVGVRVDPYYPL